ncbi:MULTISPECIES: hypothetical protein [Lysinibacillus]|uniref:Uncharacterized protein n=1 Tax=Lysinibacillus antri TaxID=2498145 RepID=A0A3S0PN69_9BACI|nr:MULTISPECIES: hypothetical protein [Lysinibacillus]RUL49820.1 hypothetical protein EK386_14790 [Lysinibacillus antri]TSI07358.1 hypothetical protein FJQ64_08640 [Lysinibacillus sp. BW-2-10]
MYYETYPNEMDLFFGGLFVVVIIVGLILALVGYILTAIIYYNSAKVNGLGDIAFWSWIPVLNVYALFALGSSKTSIEGIKKDALMFTLIYFGLLVVSFIPFIGILTSIAMAIIAIYFMYRLFYRWTGDSGKAILFIVLTLITGSIFFYIYGLIMMKKPFVA